MDSPRLLNRLRRRWLDRPLAVWYAPEYRLPWASMEGASAMDPRRADSAMWYLLDRRVISNDCVHAPPIISYADLARVHTAAHLESLSDPTTLGRVFGATAEEVRPDEWFRTFRLACGATVAAARETLRTRHPSLNLLGGFHHALPGHGAGFCPVNDIAVAVAALRADGFQERISVLDLDAHQPDGTAECLKDDRQVWIGSLSGTQWDVPPGVDETTLPPKCPDDAYLAALEQLLGRMPEPKLAFVLAGGDVLAGDRFGALGLTLAGARRRDLTVAHALHGVPSVWLPAGGYNADAWRVLAGTALALALGTRHPIRRGYDPMRARFALIAQGLDPKMLGDEPEETTTDIRALLGLQREGPPRLLGFYTAEGLEYALFRYGVLDHLQRLGYSQFRTVVDDAGVGDRQRLFGQADGREYLLLETVLEKKTIEDELWLYVHWLLLQNPRVAFGEGRPRLPGQEAPGLGMAKEAGEMLARIAERLGLAGVAFRPAWFHTAYSARYHFRFLDPVKQARFEAMLRDLAHVPLLELTTAMAEGRVLLDDAPYRWEPEVMVFRLRPEAGVSVRAVSNGHFSLLAKTDGQPR